MTTSSESKKEKVDISKCAIRNEESRDFENLAQKNFYVPTHKNMFAACHIDFFYCLYAIYQRTGKGIRTSLHKEYFIAPDRFKEWNNMLATPTLGKIEEIFTREGLEVTLAIECIESSEERGYKALEIIDDEDADNYLCYKFGSDYADKRSISAYKKFMSLPQHAQEQVKVEDKALFLPTLLRQFCYIYYSFHDKIDHILNAQEEKNLIKIPRMTTSAVIDQKADWNISVKRMLINRPAVSFSLENVDKFTQNITLPLKYAIRLVPSRKELPHLSSYNFIPYNQLNLAKRELIHFFDKKSSNAKFNL